MNVGDLKGRAIVTLSDAAKVGSVDDVLFDAQYREVLGFRVKKGGLLSGTEALLRSNVSAVGADAITVPSPDAINAEERFAELAGAAAFKQAQGTRVVTEGGTLLGTVNEVELDEQARRHRLHPGRSAARPHPAQRAARRRAGRAAAG